MPFVPVDTAIQVTVGPLVDDTDFKSLETGVAFNAAGMSVDLIEKGENASSKTDLTLTSGGTSDWVELGNGMYSIEITAAQNNTEGTLQLVGVATGILPFMSPVYAVLPTKVYDSLVNGSDNLEIDVAQWLGTAAATPTTAGVPEVDVTHVAGTAQTAGDIIADLAVIDTNVDQIETTVITNAAGVDIAADIIAVKAETALIVADTNELQTDDVPGLIAALNDFAPAVDVVANVTLVDTVTNVTNQITAAANADAVWDEALAGHVAAGSFGKAVADIESDVTAILADTNELQSDDVPGLIAALNDISTADVNGEMVDVMTVDTNAELAQGKPTATPTFVEMAMLPYMVLRNKLDVTATLLEIHNDAGTVIAKKTLSDNGTTYSEAEAATGP